MNEKRVIECSHVEHGEIIQEINLGDGGSLLLCQACFHIVTSAIVRNIVDDALKYAMMPQPVFME